MSQPSSPTYPDVTVAAYYYPRTHPNEALSGYPIPYFPNATVNWDNSPRAHPDAKWNAPAPHVINPVMQGNTPTAFREATRMIAERLNALARPQAKTITVNAWNEWPEGSCLEPGTKTGYGYLEAIGTS